jgi:transcriptional regulator with XRE-family HTH domain
LVLHHSTTKFVECQDLFQKFLNFFSKNVDSASIWCYNDAIGGDCVNYLKEVGLRIMTLRRALGITQEALALKVGYTSRSSINKIEKGIVDIPQSKLTELADALLTTPAYIMGWEEETPEEPKLSEGERLVLEAFRQIPEEQQKHFLEMIRAYANSLKKD